jgi:hypothetical protein
VCEGADNFTAAEANTVLRDLGHKVANITEAIDTMKQVKPQLILQVGRTGSTPRARKFYKLSSEGAKRVEMMISG